MPVKPGDKIRILKDGLQCARVAKGDVLTVDAFVGPDDELLVAGDWWFGLDQEGTGFEVVTE